MTQIRAPKHLSASSKRLYRQIVADYDLQAEAHALEVLRLALEAVDRAADARDAIAKHGAVYEDRFGAPRARPEVAIERDARLAAMRGFRELSLDNEPSDFRPPRAGTGALN